MANIFYNRAIRKIVTSFGDLFSNIYLARYDSDGLEEGRMLIPIAYAQKEKYVQRLEGDPDLEKKVQITLPRFSYEMNGFSYDSSRKQNTNIKNVAQTPNGAVSQYIGVPYNFDFSLYLYVRNIEDGHQVLEHILSYFTPDYTIKINMIPEMGIIKEVPVVFNSTNQEIEYEGDRESDTRLVIYTLTFTVKGYIFGPTSSTGLITHSITNVLNQITPEDVIQFNIDSASGTGTYKIGETVFQGYSPQTAIASAKVVYFNNDILHLKNINGNFISTKPIIGVDTNASYNYSSYTPVAGKFVEIDTIPNPPTANANSAYTYNTTITEYQ